MMRIGTVGRVGAAQGVPAGRARGPAERPYTEAPTPPARALVALDGGRRDAPGTVDRPGAGRPSAGFVAQLIVAGDPSLRPSRLERTRAAAALYAETARRLA